MARALTTTVALALLTGCGASVRAESDGGSSVRDSSIVRGDASLIDRVDPPLDSGVITQPDATMGLDVVFPPPPDVVFPPPPDVMFPPFEAGVRGDARGEWRMTTFRFNLNGTPAQLTDTNRTLSGDPVNRYRVNGTLDVTSNQLAFAWGVLRNDHAFVSDPSVEIDEGYSLTAFMWGGTLDDAAQRFVSGAVSLDFTFDSANVLRLSSARDGWTALFVREMRTAAALAPGQTLDGVALQISPPTSDAFVRPRVALLWDLPRGAAVAEAASSNVTFGAGNTAATYRMVLPSIPDNAFGIVGGARVAFAHLVIYDDVDRSGSFNSSMAGGTGPDIVRGVSPIGVGVRLGARPDPSFATSPFRLLKEGWQFVNVERNSDPRPAVLVPYAMSNPVRPDIPVSETAVRRRILDLVP
jgi:hypothetical protein